MNLGDVPNRDRATNLFELTSSKRNQGVNLQPRRFDDRGDLRGNIGVIREEDP